MYSLTFCHYASCFADHLTSASCTTYIGSLMPEKNTLKISPRKWTDRDMYRDIHTKTGKHRQTYTARYRQLETETDRQRQTYLDKYIATHTGRQAGKHVERQKDSFVIFSSGTGLPKLGGRKSQVLYFLININNQLTYLQCINKSISVCLYLYVCLGVCVPVSLSASLSLYVCLHPGRLCSCICLPLSLCLHVCLSVCISVCSCVYLPVYAILRVSASGSVRSSVCQSAYLYICMGVSIDMSQ